MTKAGSYGLEMTATITNNLIAGNCFFGAYLTNPCTNLPIQNTDITDIYHEISLPLGTYTVDPMPHDTSFLACGPLIYNYKMNTGDALDSNLYS